MRKAALTIALCIASLCHAATWQCTSVGCNPSGVRGVQTGASAQAFGSSSITVVVNVVGTVSAGSFTVDTSPDGTTIANFVSNGSGLGSISATANGGPYTAAGTFNYISPNFGSGITGTGTVYVTITFGGTSTNVQTVSGTVNLGTGANTIGATTPVMVSSFATNQQSVTTSAAALGTQATARGICVEALSSNTLSIFIGGSGVTTSSGLELPAGAAWCGPLSNSNLIYVIASATGQTVTWFAL